jgi:LAO/AO transport system kinase
MLEIKFEQVFSNLFFDHSLSLERRLAKLITLVDNPAVSYIELNSIIESLGLNSMTKIPILGVTGPAGAGKSTFIGGLISNFVAENISVAVLAFDPSSKITGGSFLGDRVRSLESLSYPQTYFRSIASRGQSGGLSEICEKVILVLNLFKFDVILIETTGVGQNETDIRDVADKVILLIDSNSGDVIQADKSGIMEIADLIILSKADLNMSQAFENGLLESVRWRNQQTSSSTDVIKLSMKTDESIQTAYLNVLKILKLARGCSK